MKLTADTLRVKPVSAAAVFVASLLTGTGLLLLWSTAPDDDTQLDHFGQALAASLASQVIEPLIAEDLIHLGVLANRLIELPEVSGITILSVDDRMLALSGEVRRGRAFAEQVVHNGTSIGVVRVHINEAIFGQNPPAGWIALSLLWMCLVPVAILLIAGLSPSARRRPARRPVASAEDAAVEEVPEVCYLVTVNLFNQLSLSPEQCAAELALARELAGRVAELYNGQLVDLPGTGLLLRFAATDSDDRPFHVLCAAFTLSRLLAETDSQGRYRMGSHIELISPTSADDWLRDSAVLSALAKDNTLLVSRALFERIPYNQRINSKPLVHRLLDELETIGGGAYLARDLADPHRELVNQQVAELSYSTRSTASESTF